MKPRNKEERKVMELYKRIPKLYRRIENKAIRETFVFHGYKSKGMVTCMECGAVFTSEHESCSCPLCKKKLIITNTRKTKLYDGIYISVMDVIEDYQVITHYEIHRRCYKGKEATYSTSRTFSYFVNEKHEHVVSKCRAYNHGMYNFSSNPEMQIRVLNEMHYQITDFNHVNAILPSIARNGFNGFHNIWTIDVLFLILRSRQYETLYKLGYYDLFKTCCRSSRNPIEKNNWDLFKVCFKNKYIPEDASIWIDMVNIMKGLGMNIYDASNVCPIDLHEKHNEVLAIKRNIDIEIEAKKERERKEREKNKHLIFAEKVKRFGDLVIKGNNIKIVVLTSEEQYKQEGDVLNHCVWENGYQYKPNTLILSARIRNQPKETIELDIAKFNVIQCRGYGNKDSEYHKEILNAINNNIGMIKRIARNTRSLKQYTV